MHPSPLFLSPTSLLPLFRALRTGTALALGGLAATAAAAASLQPYASEAEFQSAIERWRSRAAALAPARSAGVGAGGSLASDAAVAQTAAAPAPAAPAAKMMAESSLQAPATAAESITNVQTAGVDEGGIVKRAGDHLVILRRARLFTVRIGGDALAPAAAIDAFAPGTDPQGAWYDELLVSGSTVVVIGYSYARGGTEIGLFDLRPDGAMSHRATWHLRSFDYYSSRNYASRLIGRQLVFYTPQLMQPGWRATPDAMPGLRRWQGAATPPAFQRLLPATRIHRTDDDFDPRQPLALHTVTSCDLGAAELACESQAVLGPAGRVFYVSAGSVYVWTVSNPWRRGGIPREPQARPLSAVFRLPLDGAAPTALKTAGVPIDALSFLEDGRGHLNVLLRDTGGGEGMWAGEAAPRGAMALLRVLLADFGDGRQAAERRHYRPLPSAPAGALHNRYVGNWLLWGGTGAPTAFALPLATFGTLGSKSEPLTLDAGHAIERIEALGPHAVLVGNRRADLHLSAVRLGTDGDATLAGRHVQAGVRQGETRTHGFFYRATGRDDGLLGLPVLGAGATVRPWGAGRPAGSAAVMFLRQRDLSFSRLGQLDAEAAPRRDDGCKASCVDWYGNARPIFIGERVFALMGYELVEGRLDRGPWSERLVERQRISFAPERVLEGGRHWPFQ